VDAVALGYELGGRDRVPAGEQTMSTTLATAVEWLAATASPAALVGAGERPHPAVIPSISRLAVTAMRVLMSGAAIVHAN
jgi:hypothetical protein